MTTEPAVDAASTPEPLLTRSFVILIIAHFLQALGFSSMLLLPLYLQHLHASRTEIGAIMATGAVSGLLVRPLIGWSLDNLGRKPTLLVGTLLTIVGMELVGAVDAIDAVIYVERAVLGIGLSALFTAYFTFAADLVPVSRRTEGLALFGVSGLLPMLVNPFADRIGIAPPDLRWFLPAVGGAIALSFVAVLFIPEKRRGERPQARLKDALVALRKRPLWPVWLATTVFSALVAVFFTFATVAAEKRGIERPASMWLTYALGAVTVRLLGARVPDRIGPSNMVAPAIGFYVAAMVLSADAASFGDFSIAALAAGVGHGYCFPVLTSQVVTRSPEIFRGSALALFTALWGVSELAVSPAFGAIADRWGDGAMFMAAAVTGIASLVGWLVLEHRFGAN